MITAEELEKLAELKEKGIITEEEFNAKRDEFLNQNTASTSKQKLSNINLKFSSKKALIACLAILLIAGGYFLKRPQKIATGSGIGKNGFSISISCTFNGAQMPLQSCTGKSEAVLETGANRHSYNGYNMPSYYDVPEHFDFFIYNGSDKFTINMVVTDKATRSTIARRQIGPYDGDRIRN